MAEVDSLANGTFELADRGGGHLRSAKRGYLPHPTDIFVSPDIARGAFLKGGEDVEGELNTRQSKGRRQPPKLAKILRVNGLEPEDFAERTPFEDLIAIDPQQAVQFEIPGGSPSMRVIDLLMPIGLGQRGLIAAPPRTGKTMLLQQMAAGVAENHPDVYMMVLLIDERPEEVTEMRRTVHGEVAASSNDRDASSHVRLARLMIAKAKRMVECGRDVFILFDSLTRMGRSFNSAIRGSSRIMSGGLDIRALEEPKRIFGAARNAEGGGSLTIIATALIETGSRMDEVIFNEFKGTGNMEIMLTRELADRRIWPAIKIDESGTRKEELLLGPKNTAKVHRIRRALAGKDPVVSMERLLTALGHHKTNADFLASQPD